MLESEQIAAIDADPRSIKDMSNPCKEAKELAVTKDAFTLEFIEEQTEELCLLAIQHRPINDKSLLKYVKVQTQDICDAAIKANPYECSYAKPEFLTSEIITKCLDDQNGWYAVTGMPASSFTPVVINAMLNAMLNDSYMNIQHIPKELVSDEIVQRVSAVNVDAVKYIPVEYQTDELWLRYIESVDSIILDGLRYREYEGFFTTATRFPNAVYRILEKCPEVIHFIEQKPEFCLYAIKQKPDMIFYFQTPTDDMWRLAIELEPKFQCYSPWPTTDFLDSIRADSSKAANLKYISPAIADVLLEVDPLIIPTLSAINDNRYCTCPGKRNFDPCCKLDSMRYQKKWRQLKYILSQNPYLATNFRDYPDDVFASVIIADPTIYQQIGSANLVVQSKVIEALPYMIRYFVQTEQNCRLAVARDRNVVVLIRDKALREQLTLDSQKRFRKTKTAR